MKEADLGMHAPVGLAITDADLRIVAANETLGKWLGSSPEGLVGRSLRECMPVASQLFIETHAWPLLAMQQSVRELVLELGPARMPVLFNADRAPDGRVHVALIDIRDRRGYEKELQGARRRAEEAAARHALVAAVGPKLVHALDIAATAEVAVANAVPALADACVLELRAHGTFRGGHDDLCEAFLAATPDADRGAVAPPGPQFASFPVAEGRLGKLTFLSHGLAAAWDEATLAEYVGLVGLALDRAILHAQARDAVRARETLIGMLGHEFANPLTALRMHVALWRKGHPEPAPDVDRLLGVIERNVDQMDRLVKDMLDVSRIRSGRFELAVQPADLAEVARETVRRMQPLFASKGATVEVQAEAATCQIDPARMDQVVSNLLTNAFRYGAPPFRVVVAKAGAAVHLRVIDHGRGIAPADRGRLFREFERLGSTTVGSTGLGLYIVKHMVAAHGGTVEVDETPGGGATFSVTLPCEDAASGASV